MQIYAKMYCSMAIYMRICIIIQVVAYYKHYSTPVFLTMSWRSFSISIWIVLVLFYSCIVFHCVDVL